MRSRRLEEPAVRRQACLYVHQGHRSKISLSATMLPSCYVTLALDADTRPSLIRFPFCQTPSDVGAKPDSCQRQFDVPDIA